MQKILLFIFLTTSFCVFAQIDKTLVKKELTIEKDTIKLEGKSIQQLDFKVDYLNERLDSTKYEINYLKGYLVLKDSLLKGKKLNIQYRKFPDFLTKVYYRYSDSIIVKDDNSKGKLFSFRSKQKNIKVNLFDGLQTNGTFSRGITMGNNQDGVLDSNLDLQITGKLSDKVSIRANITDSNAPVHNNGYSQRLNEFDRVFIEMYSKNWNVTAGDLNLLNDQHYTTFQKKIKGLSIAANNNSNSWKYFVSGGLVEGNYKQVTLSGQDANQGPYKITNEADRLLLLVSGSESVFVNGSLLERGENKDYIINYNTAEIIFNPTFPIRSTSRIVVEYQVSNSDYTRFVSDNKVAYTKDNLAISVNYFTETDFKTQPLNASFTNTQEQIIANAGDDLTQLFAPNEVETAFSNNLILYKKELLNGEEIYTFSTDETETLYTVSFTYVGENLGNYVIDETLATGRVYSYVSPISGINQGNYMPLIKLNAPNSLQVISLNGNYSVKDKTFIETNIAYSIKDNNLYSAIDDNDNGGFAGKLKIEQLLIDKPWKLSAKAKLETIQNKFNTIERVQSIEYNRDWNINSILGNQKTITTGLEYKKDSVGSVNYYFENLAVGKEFKGKKHGVTTDLKYKNISLLTNNSVLESESSMEDATFIKSFVQVNTVKNIKWIGLKSRLESNKRKENLRNELTKLSFKEFELGGFVGVGDTAKVYLEIGYQFSKMDSVQNLKLDRVVSANTFFIKTKLLANKQSNLTVYADYRETQNKNSDNEYNFNARINYRQSLLQNNISFTTIYQNSGGVVPQQDFNYIETDTGQGFFQWIDYNENGIKELDEFEIANYTDQANYLRIVLPSTNFIKVNNSKVSQLVSVNFNRWKNENGIKKIATHFSTQSTFLLDNKQEQNVSDYLNPFNTNSSISFNYQLKNAVYFNRGLQNYSFVYSNLQSKNKSYLVFTTQENKQNINRLQFFHKIKKDWLINNLMTLGKNSNFATNTVNRDYTINSTKNNLKLSYMPSGNYSVTAFYNLNIKNNEIGDLEELNSNELGLKFTYNKLDKFSFSSEFSLIDHDYSGANNTPVSFQLLEGLQPGKNYTWTLLVQKKINSFLNLNINYNGRKSTEFKTIHIGNVQLRANF